MDLSCVFGATFFARRTALLKISDPVVPLMEDEETAVHPVDVLADMFPDVPEEIVLQVWARARHASPACISHSNSNISC